MAISREFRDAARRFFSGEEPTFATVLVACVLKMYGAEALNWDGITLELEIKDDLDVEMPRKIYDQLMALINVYESTIVYTDVAVFDETVSSLNRRGMGTIKDAPSVEDVAWAVTEIGMNDPQPQGRDADQPWSRNVAKYIRAVLKDEGFTIAPKALEFTNPDKSTNTAGDLPDQYAAAWGEKQAKADEVDSAVERTAVKMIQQLMTIGVEFEAAKQPA